MTYNATCQIIAPVTTSSATWAGESTVELTQDATDIRCMMTPWTAAAVASMFGQIGPRVYNCRLRTTHPVNAGWEVMVQLDGDAAAEKFIVRDAHPNAWGHTHLTLERM